MAQPREDVVVAKKDWTEGMPPELKRCLSRAGFLRLSGAGLAGAAVMGSGCGVFQSSEGGGQGGGGGGGEGGGGGGGGDGEGIAINLQDSIRGLDSATVTDEVSFNILINAFEGLQRLDADDQPTAGTAENVDVSEDGLTYTFTLRDGINWSNGDPVVADDYRFAWLKVLNPDTASQYAYIISSFIEGADAYNTGEGSADDVAIRAVDDKTLEVGLVSPAPFWLGLTAFPVYLPQKQSFVEEQGERYGQNADSLIFNGPYSLEDFNPSQGVTFVKRDDYWDADNVSIPRVQGRIVKEVDTAVNLFEAGDLDITEISQEYVDEYEGEDAFNQATEFTCFYLAFNEDVEIFRNQKVRKAFQLGFDREALVNNILNDGSAAATGLVPPGMTGPEGQTFREAVGDTLGAFNADEARRLFEEGLQEVGADNPQIELLSYETSTARDVATFLQSQFQDNLGARINVTIQPFDRKLELEADGEFQLSFQGWGADYNDPMTFLDLWTSDSSFNTGGYENQEYDRLINQAKEETDQAARMDQMIEAERLLIDEDAGVAPLFFQGTTRLINPAIQGFVYHKYGGSLDLKLYRYEP